jgi:putative addiction module component (TIGR02574 family)
MAVRRSIIDIDSLSEAERIQLAEDLWDSIAPDSPELVITPAMEALLEERVAEHRRNPGAGEPWEVVRERILAEIRRPV